MPGRSLPLCNYLPDDNQIEYLRFKDYKQAMEYSELVKEVLVKASKRYKIVWRRGKETDIFGAVFPWLEWHFAPGAVHEYVVKILIDKRVLNAGSAQELLEDLKKAVPATYRTLTDSALGKMVAEITAGG